MENSSSNVINVIAAIAGVLLVVVFVFGLIRFGISKGENLTDEIGNTIDNMLETKYTQYDGNTISGSSLQNLIQTVNSTDDTLYICVKTKANTTGVYYVCDASGAKLDSNAHRTLVTNSKTKSHSDYITPSAKFYGEVMRNANDAIIGIVFTQQ